MGGRGAWSGHGASTGGGSGGASYKDVTKQFQGMDLHKFENTIRDRKTEYVGIFDEKGKLIKATTSGSSDHAGIPEEAAGAAVLTHNHPYQGGRMIGGTFSEADVINHIQLGIGTTRAVTNGPNENTYILATKAGSNPRTLYSAAVMSRDNGKMEKIGTDAFTRVSADMKKKGYTDAQVQSKLGQIYIGSMKNFWKTEAANAKYDYIEVKKARW